MRNTRFLVSALVGLVLLCQSCSLEEGTATPITSQSSIPISSDATILSEVLSITEDESPGVMIRPAVSYLEEIIPPCVPFKGSETDPCSLITLPKVEGSIGATTTLLRVVPTFTDLLFGGYSISSTPHIVVRGTIKPNTTRCELYPVKNFSYEEPDDYYDRIKLFHHLCFVDIRINEYIVGIGPSELTVSVYRKAIWPLDPEEWPNIKDEYEATAISNTELLYEEKEMVLFLETPSTSAVEAWSVGSILFDTWFVQRNGDEIRAVSSAMDRILEGYNDELRAQMDLSLDELIRQVKEAAENRLALTEGRIGTSPGSPMFVTDANKLQDFYQQTGAVYEGERATVLPPPVPGGEEPEQSPIRTGETQSVTTSVLAPGDETSPTTTDAAGRPSSSTAASSTTATLPSSTTAALPRTEDTAAPQTTNAAPVSTTQPQTGDSLPTTTTTVLPTPTGTTRPQAEDTLPTTTAVPAPTGTTRLPAEGASPTTTTTTAPSDAAPPPDGTDTDAPRVEDTVPASAEGVQPPADGETDVPVGGNGPG